MSAIALALAEMGHHVSGSDLRERPVLDRLRAAGVAVHVGHDRSHVHGCDAVTASTAIPADLNELDEARRLGIPCSAGRACWRRSAPSARSLGVAGTHGKTTTTSMLMLILAEAGLRPSFVIGGDVTDMGTGAQWTGGEWFVVEADESDGTHLELPLHGTILTNVEIDHLDHYGSFEGIVAGFDRYLRQVAGPKVVCGDDPVAARLAAEHGAITYGTSDGVDVRAVDVRATHGTLTFAIERDGRASRRHRAAAARDAQRAQRHRRAGDGDRDRRRPAGGGRPRSPSSAASPAGSTSAASIGGATFVDDYAHLPSEIAAVLDAARAQRRRMAPGRRRVPAEPVQPHGRDLGRLRRLVRRRRPRRAHRHLPVRARSRSPASPASWSSTPCSTRTRSHGWCGCPGATTW